MHAARRPDQDHDGAYAAATLLAGRGGGACRPHAGGEGVTRSSRVRQPGPLLQNLPALRPHGSVPGLLGPFTRPLSARWPERQTEPLTAGQPALDWLRRTLFCSWAMCSRLQARAKVRPHCGASEPLPPHHREGPLRRKVGRGRGPPPGDPYCPRCCVVAFGAETPKAREGPPIPPDSLPPPRGHMELWGPAAGLPQAGRQGVAKWLWGHVLRESFSRGQFLEHRWQGAWLVEAGPLGGVEALQAGPTQQGLPWPIVTLLQAPPLPKLSRELRTAWPASRLHAGAPGQGGLGLWKVLDVLPFTVGGRRSHRN